jgi:gamma-glutamyltranspeptidase/glutathione hydrolase
MNKLLLLKKQMLLCTMVVAAVAPAAFAQEESSAPGGRDQARSMVMTKFGIVSTSQTLASQAGARVLEEGGNAIDAAIAANATLGVVEPAMNGMGGDLFAIVYEAKTGKLYGLNSSGWTPAGLTMALLDKEGYLPKPGVKEKPLGVHRITVPGAVAGWQALRQKFGTMNFDRLFGAAIYYAENGYPVTELISQEWAGSERGKSTQPGFKETYMPGGHSPKPGEIFKNPPLAASLKLVAEKGRDAFYRGPLAERLVGFLKEQGSPMTLADFAEFQPEWVDPISTVYRGWRVWELPPNSQGIAALEMLNIMERYPMAEYGHNSTKALHVMIEAKKLAYADLLKYVGDPRQAKIPVPAMLSKETANARAEAIRADKANCDPLPAELSERTRTGNDTIYMSAIDREGNIVSLIQSNYSAFGTGMVAPGTGFALHNRGGLFTLKAGEPNTIGPRKRPLHTIIPAFMEKDSTKIGFGIMGGWNQSQAHAQYVSNIVDFGMNIQAAMEAARFTKGTFGGCDVQMESRVSQKVRDELTAMGHKIRVVGAFSGSMGRGQVVESDGDGVHFAASDPRADGEAVPQGPPLFGVKK